MVAIAEAPFEGRAFELAIFKAAIKTRCASWSRRRPKDDDNARAIAEVPKVIDLMEALKLSLAQDAESEAKKAGASKPKAGKAVPNRRTVASACAKTAKESRIKGAQDPSRPPFRERERDHGLSRARRSAGSAAN